MASANDDASKSRCLLMVWWLHQLVSPLTNVTTKHYLEPPLADATTSGGTCLWCRVVVASASGTTK